MRRLYASKLTKEDLIQNGITEITKDAKIFRGNKEIFPFWLPGKRPYLGIMIYDLDINGNRIKVPITRLFKNCNKPTDTYMYKLRTIGLHRIMWAWHYNEVPEGMVVDHIDNKHETLYDYRLENLQLLTPAENLAKEKELSTRELKCKMNKPRSFYEAKLLNYEKKYEEAKSIHDANLAHKLRTNISNIRAKLRYWDSHADEYTQFEAQKQALETRKKEWKQNVQAKKEEANKRSIEAKKRAKDIACLKEWKKIFYDSENKKMWHLTCNTIKNWDTYTELQKAHVWETLGKFFGE